MVFKMIWIYSKRENAKTRIIEGKKNNKKIATNEFDSAKGFKDLFVLLLVDNTEDIISETGTFSWGKEEF